MKEAMSSMAPRAFLDALESGPYTWPGGYPVYFLMGDGEPMCFTCANDNRKRIILADRYCERDWAVLAHDVNWEDSSLICAHCGQEIEVAYDNDAPTETGGEQ